MGYAVPAAVDPEVLAGPGMAAWREVPAEQGIAAGAAVAPFTAKFAPSRRSAVTACRARAGAARSR
jgi:hypothetical protein